MPSPLLGVFLGMEIVVKILVIDDTQVHLDAAKQTLGGHDVTYCATHEQAHGLLAVQFNGERQKALVAQYKAEGMNLNDAWAKADAETKLPYWDVVLSDLLMPAGPMSQGGPGCQYVGQEMAVGWALALQAARNGAKYVAVVTDTNHHHHPASAMLDRFNRHFFTIDGARVLMTNYLQFVGIHGSEGTCPDCHGTGKQGDGETEWKCFDCRGTGRRYLKQGKDWGKILEQLLEGPTQEMSGSNGK